ncbi:MAG: amidohydrolase family protein [Thermoproteota archaeon]|jgi:imidazolonepropionase-like amidohydrolase|nr:amidohydrolase family protein [Thermoproteota archaeon]
MTAVITSISLLFISPTMTLGYTDTFQSTLPSLSNQTLTSNNTKAVILEGATLIDGTGALPKPNTTIVIDGNRIVFASNNTANNFDLNFSAARSVNLTGKYIIPGLFDMHAHVANVLKDSYNQNESEYMLHMLLTHGITTIRNPGGPTEQSVALRDNVSEGIIAGPQIFTAGQLLNTPQIPVPFVEKEVQTEQDVRQEVRAQAAAGVDYIKLYVGLTPDLVKAAIDEAHFYKKKIIGHLYMTSWTDAANLGIDALTHGVPVSPFLLSEANQQKFLDSGDHPFNHLLWLDLVDLNGPEINNMISGLVNNNIPVDPTLDIYEIITKESQHQYLWPKVLQLTKKLYDNGVTILSGSDIPNFDLVPGASLHHELELLIEAGISPLEVIKIATKNGAQALGIEEDVGTIEPGKQADMIILSDNPVEDIHNTKKIEAVINNGHFIER